MSHSDDENDNEHFEDAEEYHAPNGGNSPPPNAQPKTIQQTSAAISMQATNDIGITRSEIAAKTTDNLHLPNERVNGSDHPTPQEDAVPRNALPNSPPIVNATLSAVSPLTSTRADSPPVIVAAPSSSSSSSSASSSSIAAVAHPSNSQSNAHAPLTATASATATTSPKPTVTVTPPASSSSSSSSTSAASAVPPRSANASPASPDYREPDPLAIDPNARFMVKNLDTGEVCQINDAEKYFPEIALTSTFTLASYEEKNKVGETVVITANAEKGSKETSSGSGHSVQDQLKHMGFKVLDGLKSVVKKMETGEKEKDKEKVVASNTVKVKNHKRAHNELTDVRLVQEVQYHSGPIWTLALSADGQFLASAGQDSIVRVWAILGSPAAKEMEEREKEHKMKKDSEVNSNAASATLAPGTSGGSVSTPSTSSSAASTTSNTDGVDQPSWTVSPTYVEIPRALGGRRIIYPIPYRQYSGHKADVIDLSWSKANFLLSASVDKTARLWHVSRARCLCLSPDHVVLTRCGLKPIADVKVGDEVLSIQPRRSDLQEMSTYKHLEWKKVTDTQKVCLKCGKREMSSTTAACSHCSFSSAALSDSAQRLYRVHSKDVDVVATADHSWFVFGQDDAPKFVKTSQFDRTQKRNREQLAIPLSGLELTNDFRIEVNAPADLKQLLDEQWHLDHQCTMLTIIGAILGDGQLSKEYEGMISVTERKPETQKALLELFEKAGAPFNSNLEAYRAKLSELNCRIAGDPAYQLQTSDEQHFVFTHAGLYHFLLPMFYGPDGYDPLDVSHQRNWPNVQIKSDMETMLSLLAKKGSDSTWWLKNPSDLPELKNLPDFPAPLDFTPVNRSFAPTDIVSASSPLATAYRSDRPSPSTSYLNQPNGISWNSGLFIVINSAWFNYRRWLGSANMESYFSRVSSRQAHAFLYGFVIADGVVVKKVDGDIWKIFTSSIPMRDHAMTLAVIAGASVSTARSDSDKWQVVLKFCSDNKQCSVNVDANVESTELDGEEMEVYREHGFVYDITVEDNHNFWVRRLWSEQSSNSKPSEYQESSSARMSGCFTGNCSFLHPDFVTAVAFHPVEDRYFMSGCFDKKLRLWNIPEHRVVEWAQPSNIITSAAFSPNGVLAGVGLYSGQCVFYQTEGLKYFTQIDCRNRHGRNRKGKKVTGIQWSKDGKYLLVTTNDSRLRLYSMDDYSMKIKYKGLQNDELQIRAQFSEDGHEIICGSENECVYVWKKDEGELDSEDAGGDGGEDDDPEKSGVHDHEDGEEKRREEKDGKDHAEVVQKALKKEKKKGVFKSLFSSSSSSDKNSGKLTKKNDCYEYFKAASKTVTCAQFVTRSAIKNAYADLSTINTNNNRNASASASASAMHPPATSSAPNSSTSASAGGSATLQIPGPSAAANAGRMASVSAAAPSSTTGSFVGTSLNDLPQEIFRVQHLIVATGYDGEMKFFENRGARRDAKK